MITKEQIKACNPDSLATFITAGRAPLTNDQHRVLAIACRNGGYVCAGNGAHNGSVERVAATTIRSLVNRGYLAARSSPDGGYAADFSPNTMELVAHLINNGAK